MTLTARLVLMLPLALAPVAAHAGPSPMTPMSAQALQSPEVAENRAAMMKMHKAMMVKPTGDADADFVAGMIPHHQGAVDMAQVELRYGHDPEMRKLAQDIVSSQDRQIAQMKAWQQSHAK